MTILSQGSARSGEEFRWAAFQSRIESANTAWAAEHPAVPLYALIDARGLPDLRTALKRLESVPFEALWDGTDLSAFKDISPLLIAVDSAALDVNASIQLLRRIWRFAEESFAVTWVWSPKELGELANHFRAYTEYTLPDRRAFYLHFCDNRILERLRLVWTQEEQDCFASAASEIWYRGRAGEDCVWHVEIPCQPRTQGEFTMTDEQHLALLALGSADKVALQLTEICGVRLEHLSPDELYMAICDQMKRAARYGIRGEKDLLAYVSKGLLVSARFDEHPEIHALLQSTADGRIAFGEVLSQVDDDFRQTLQALGIR